MKNQPKNKVKNQLIVDDQFLLCECQGEILRINFDEELKCFYFSFYRHGQPQHSFLDRLKLFWRVLKTGDPYHDQMILDKKNAAKVRDFINKYIKLL